MLLFLAVILIVAIVVVVFYLTGGQTSVLEGEAASEAVVSEETAELSLSPNRVRQAFSGRPLFELLQDLPQTIEPYTQNWRQKITDEQSLLNLLSYQQKIDKLSSDIVSGAVTQTELEQFPPLKGVDYWDFKQQMALFSDDILCDVNNLLNEPEVIIGIYDKLRAFVVLQESLNLLFDEYQNLMDSLAQRQDFSQLVMNEVKVLSHREAAWVQIELFLRYFYSWQLFHSFAPVVNQRLADIFDLIDKTCQVLEAAKSYYTINDHQALQKNQRLLLDKQRVISDFFSHFYSGFVALTEQFSQSAIMEIEDNIDVFVNFSTALENDILPSCAKYASPAGNEEAIYIREFKKVYQNYNPKSRKNILPLNAAETLKGFLQNRKKELQQLMEPAELEPVKNIISSVFRSLTASGS